MIKHYFSKCVHVLLFDQYTFLRKSLSLKGIDLDYQSAKKQITSNLQLLQQQFFQVISRRGLKV